MLFPSGTQHGFGKGCGGARRMFWDARAAGRTAEVQNCQRLVGDPRAVLVLAGLKELRKGFRFRITQPP